MKPYLLVSKFPTLILLSAVTLVITTNSASAQAPVTHTLVLTETSSTPTSPTSPGLAATYDGVTTGVSVNFISPDHWGVTVSNVTFTGNPQWTEPEDPTAFNVITLLAPPGQFIVNSDYLNNGTSPLANDTPFANFGTDSRDGGSISVTFNDLGDAAAVPDSGSSLGLLLLPLTALFGLCRSRSVRAA